MGIEFSDQWLTYGGDHVTAQVTAEALLRSAAQAMANTNRVEILTWANAVSSPAPQQNGNFIELYKGDHRIQGTWGQFAHLTGRVKIKKTYSTDNHSLTGAFHLYVEILGPVVGKTKEQLRSRAVSYSQQDNTITEDIQNATEVDSDKAPAREGQGSIEARWASLQGFGVALTALAWSARTGGTLRSSRPAMTSSFGSGPTRRSGFRLQ